MQQCSICFTSTANCTIECGHTFCRTCLEKCQNQCPTCRQPFERIIRVYGLRTESHTLADALSSLGMTNKYEARAFLEAEQQDVNPMAAVGRRLLKRALDPSADLSDDDAKIGLQAYRNACLAKDKKAMLEIVQKYSLRMLLQKSSDTKQMVALVDELVQDGEVKHACHLMESIMETCERECGDSHKSTMICRGKMIQLLLRKEVDDLERAESLARKDYHVREARFGIEHRCTFNAQSTLGQILKQKGNTLEAEMFYTMCLEGKERILGREHPETLKALNNVGSILIDMNDLDRAEEMLQRALLGHTRVFGSDSMHTLNVSGNVGLLLCRRAWNESGTSAYAKRHQLEGCEMLRIAHHRLTTEHKLPADHPWVIKFARALGF